MALTYYQQLKHPSWQKKRLEMLESANWECDNCGCKETSLHVHHKQYIKGRMAWEYESTELRVLCEDCHQEEHYIQDELKELLANIDSTQSLALLRGFHVTSDWFDTWIGDAGRDRDALTYATGFAAFLFSSLTIDQMYEAAKYIVSLTKENSEARMILDDRKFIFGQD